jgi:7-cyano-7-deazaguanine synthase in queuosine biosynthesis
MATKLVLLSGGLDSLCMTHLMLKSAKDNDIHIHHVNITNIEGRASAEATAVKNAIEYFQDNDYPKFIYTESTVAAPNFGRSFMYDSDAVNFMAGYVCSMDKDIQEVAIGLNKSDTNGPNTTRIQKANQLLALFTTATKIYPVKDYTKQEMYDLLPEGLRTVFWSCRTPKYVDGVPNACGHCHTCQQIRQLTATLPS